MDKGEKMKQIAIPIHSIIDVITNSSTEIYTNTHSKSIEYAKDLINEILDAAGSDKTADDLFEFEIIEDEEHDPNDWNCMSAENTLKITSKGDSEKPLNLLNKLQNIFSQEAHYDG